MRTLTDRARKYFGVSDRYPHNPETLQGSLSGEFGFPSLEVRLLPKPPRGRGQHRTSDRLQARCPECKKWFGTGNLEQHLIVHGVGSEGAIRHHAHIKARGYPESLRRYRERVTSTSSSPRRASRRDPQKSAARYCIQGPGARRRYFDSLEEAKKVASEIHRRTGVIVGITSVATRGHKRDPQKSSMTVYAATIWWRDSDPLMTVVAKTAAKAKALAFKAMKEEAKQAYDSEQFDKLYQAQDALAWSGVHAFDLHTLAQGREYEEALDDLRARGYAYLSGH